MGQITSDQNLNEGYRAYLPSESHIPGFTFIGFGGSALILSRTNRRLVNCIECRQPIEAGGGIYHREFERNGFLHLDCAKTLIVEICRQNAILGFTENILFNLQACYLSRGKFTVEQVIRSIRQYDPELPKAGDLVRLDKVNLIIRGN